MNFIEKILDTLGNIGDFIGDIIGGLVDFLSAPLSYLLAFLEGIFYFISKFFTVVVEILQLFVALFQFFFAIVTGLFRTVSAWVGFTPSSSYSLPSTSRLGFETALEQIGGTGLLTVVPLILIAILWLFFAYKIIKLLGDKGEVSAK